MEGERLMNTSLIDIEMMRNQLVKDVAEGSSGAASSLILLYLTSAFELGKEARERELRASGRVI